jgi:brefeldin A-inhibited guanine nucleotide-exchange protein
LVVVAVAQPAAARTDNRLQVLSNSIHNWDHVPENFCRQLRQPLCMALLRNCATPDAAAYSLALKLLMAILNLPRLRTGLRAELGAFYPLLVLRYLEQQAAASAQRTAGGAAGAAASSGGGAGSASQQQQPDGVNVLAALSALQGLLADPQLLVDLYVNFDCDLQAGNLYERTVQVCVDACWCLV